MLRVIMILFFSKPHAVLYCLVELLRRKNKNVVISTIVPYAELILSKKVLHHLEVLVLRAAAIFQVFKLPKVKRKKKDELDMRWRK